MRARPLIVVACAGLALAAGCGRRVDDGSARADLTSATIHVDHPAAAEPTIIASEDDAAIARDLRSVLEADDSLSGRAKAIAIEARGGRVFLRGRVVNVREKSEVLAQARSLAGSESVVDEIDVARP